MQQNQLIGYVPAWVKRPELIVHEEKKVIKYYFNDGIKNIDVMREIFFAKMIFSNTLYYKTYNLTKQIIDVYVKIYQFLDLIPYNVNIARELYSKMEQIRTLHVYMNLKN